MKERKAVIRNANIDSHILVISLPPRATVWHFNCHTTCNSLLAGIDHFCPTCPLYEISAKDYFVREQKLIQTLQVSKSPYIVTMEWFSKSGYRVSCSDRGMSQCEWPDSIIFSKNINKQISKLISFIGKCILAGGLQKHAIYAKAVKPYKATQKHRSDAFSFAAWVFCRTQNAECTMMVSGIECETGRYIIYDKLISYILTCLSLTLTLTLNHPP